LNRELVAYLQGASAQAASGEVDRGGAAEPLVAPSYTSR
jgi:hypothetical protein